MTITINVATQTPGAISANSLAPSDFTNPLETVAANSNWTPLSTKYLYYSADNKFTVQSIATWRDVEVISWARWGYIYLRLNANKAIYFIHNGETANGLLEIGIVTGLDETAFPGGIYYTLCQNTDLLHTVTGYDKTDTTGAYFIFGASGFDIYAKFYSPGSGLVNICTFKDYRCMDAGTVALKSLGSGFYGFRDNITITPLTPATLYSDYAIGELDLRDFNVRSNVSSTGSMTGGGFDITLNATMNVAVGDWVLIGVGGEGSIGGRAGGTRGTIGAGGVWPTLNYADYTTLNADKTQADNTVGWTRDTGLIYYYNLATTTWIILVTSQHYYYNKSIPIAYQGRITIISSDQLTLTMDTAASVTTNNALVYLDNGPYINYLTEIQDGSLHFSNLTLITPTNITIIFPAGVITIGSQIQIGGHTGWTLQGQGIDVTTIQVCKGARPLQIVAAASPSCTMKDFTAYSNWGTDGFGFAGPAFYHTILVNCLDHNGAFILARSGENVTTQLVPSQNWIPLQGLGFYNGSQDGVVQDCKTVEIPYGCITASFTTNVWAYRMQAVLTQPTQDYVQWCYEFDTSDNSGAVDCSFVSTYLAAGFEFFKGGHGNKFIRCTSINGGWSMNACEGYEITDCTSTVTALSQPPGLEFPSFYDIHNSNMSINVGTGGGSTTLGGTLTNFNIVMNYINTNNDMLGGIVVNISNPNITIIGGSYVGPNYAAPSILPGPQGINSTGTNLQVSGYSCCGIVNGIGQANILASSGNVTGCIADTIILAGVTPPGNLTCAQYALLRADLNVGVPVHEDSGIRIKRIARGY